MRKCPNCAKENINESLFCENCGRCLLVPDPAEGQWATATHTEHYEIPEGIPFYDGHRIKTSGVGWPMRRHPTRPSVIVGWLLLLNLLVCFLMSEIAKYIVIK